MKTNHRRGFKANTNRRNEYPLFRKISALADVHIWTSLSCGGPGRRGQALSIARAKKFGNSRFRLQEKSAIRRLLATGEWDCVAGPEGDVPALGWWSEPSASLVASAAAA